MFDPDQLLDQALEDLRKEASVAHPSTTIVHPEMQAKIENEMGERILPQIKYPAKERSK